MTNITGDIETNNLLNNESINYNASPYCLKDTYKTHCIVLEIHETNEIIAFYDGDKYILDGREFIEKDDKYTYELKDYEPIKYTHYQLGEFPNYIKGIKDLNKVIFHNGINFDFLSCKLYFDMDYTIGGLDGESDTWCGREVDIVDTMILSKTLNSDRFCGHSLDKLSKVAGGAEKIDFRPHVPKKDMYNTFAADMLYYNIFDVKSNTDVYNYLEHERTQDGWDWDAAIRLEKKTAEIVTRSSHRGFKFDVKLAEKCIHELDELMSERRQRVEPLLPPRAATKKFLKEHTPPASQVLTKDITLPKKFFNKDLSLSKTATSWLEKWDGEYDDDKKIIKVQGNVLKRDTTTGFPEVAFTQQTVAAHMVNFVNKHNGVINEDDMTVELFGEVYKLPVAVEPLKTTMVAEIKNTTHIKEWLVSLGWQPSEYKMKDITLKSGTKIKRDSEDLEKAVDRYIAETLESEFCKDRCAQLKARPTEHSLKRIIMEKANKYGCKVLTSPSFTIGQEKELCKDLERIAERFPYVQDIVEYLTYKHRRSSILGGDVDWDSDEEPEKGYMAHVRDDGRIAAPADTLGAATGRMRHKNIVNVPRVSSLYGKEMRSLFKVEDDCLKIGSDMASLEARLEGHYCHKYDVEGKPYCKSLTLSQPNDVHSLTANYISSIIGKDFSRSNAKSVKYSCLPVENTEVLTTSGWKYYHELCEGDEILNYNVDTNMIERDFISKLHYYKDAEIMKVSNKFYGFEATPDHRWYGWNRRMKGSGKTATRFNEYKFFTTEEMNSEYNILCAAPYKGGSSIITKDESALVAWLLSDGYYFWSDRSETTSASNGRLKGIVASISQSKNKFYKEVEQILGINNIEYTKDFYKKDNGNDVYTYRLKSNDIRDFMGRVVKSRNQKHEVDWASWVLDLSKDALDSFIYNFWLADGASKGMEFNKCTKIYQNEGKIADAVALALYLQGNRISITDHTQEKKCKNITQLRLSHFGMGNTKKEMIENKDVFCLTAPNSTFIFRQNGFISITGNCTFGGGASKIANIIGESSSVGEIVFDSFWKSAAPLTKLKVAVEKWWEAKGNRKFIKGLDGRQVRTRFKHALLNSLLQSGGAIATKTMAVFHDQLLTEEGLQIDFFKDDWKNTEFNQLMIIMHDEIALEESKSRFKFKKFNSEEDALTFSKEDDRIWSEVIEGKNNTYFLNIDGINDSQLYKTKGEAKSAFKRIEGKCKVLPSIGNLYYLAHTKAGELISKAVEMTNNHYKLKVPLEMGYAVGVSWADTH